VYVQVAVLVRYSAGSEVPPNDPSGGRTTPRSVKLLLGGWMTMGAGVLALFNGLQTIVGGDPLPFTPEFVITRYTICATVVIAFGLIAIAGGISAMQERRISLALAGAFLGMIGDGVIGFWLGLFSLVLFALSSQDL